jgi:hypothetical protein
VIGRRTSSGWITDAAASAAIEPQTDYALRVTIDDRGAAALYVDGAPRVSHRYSGSLTDGAVGLGTNNAVSRFDDFSLQETAPPPSATLPHAEDFEDGVADFFEPRAGAWAVAGGRYSVTPAANSDGVSTLRVASLPADLEIAVTVNADAAASGRFSNAFIIFDYQGPANFKFAGTYVGGGQWLIGRRTASGWITDSAVSASVAPGTDYRLRLTIDGSGLATLYADGVPRVSRQYAESLTDGAVGLGTSNAISRFDDLAVQSPATVQAASSPFAPAGDSFFPANASGREDREFDGARQERQRERSRPTIWRFPTLPHAPNCPPPADLRGVDEAFAQFSRAAIAILLDGYDSPSDDAVLDAAVLIRRDRLLPEGGAQVQAPRCSLCSTPRRRAKSPCCSTSASGGPSRPGPFTVSH